MAGRTIEVCSLMDGAWYDVRPEDCRIMWCSGRPSIYIKFMDFGYEDCELFGLERLHQKRIRDAFTVAEESDELQVGEKVVGLAKSVSEQKWFDAEVVRVRKTEDDVLLTVEWCMGLSVVIFGMPYNDVLSVKEGEVCRPKTELSEETQALVDKWINDLQELSGSTIEFEIKPDTNPTLQKPISYSQVMDAPPSEWAPSSFLRKRSTRKKKKVTNGASPQPAKKGRKDHAVDSRSQQTNQSGIAD